MSGQWPPEWEDPDDERADAGLPDQELADAGHSNLDLSEVTSLLASVHTPALPASFEVRISAAIAAEAAARATTTPAAAEPSAAPMAGAEAADANGTVHTSADHRPRRGSRASRRAARATGPGNSRPDSRRRRLRMPSTQAAGWVLLCCLVIAGFGFLVTHGGASSSSSEAASSTSGQAPSAAAGTAGLPNSGLGPEHAADEPSAASSASAATGFLVHSTGTAYKRSTLVSQVQGQLASYDFGNQGPKTPDHSAGATAPASSAGSSTVGGATPSGPLSGCVERVTSGAEPSLVDKASYDGIPAYIIAVPTEVWVVRLGCTATDTQLIVAVPIKG